MKIGEDFFERKRIELGVSLNKVQKEAVLHTEGALLLLASPGSGKTTTIIMRIGYLIEEKKVDPSRIKAVTFSRASARDMKERFKRFFPALSGEAVNFSTIHSLAFEVTREYFRKTGTIYQIIEGNSSAAKTPGFSQTSFPLNKKLILRRLFHRVVGENITEEQLEELTNYSSFIKNKLVPKQKWSQFPCEVPEAGRILLEYEKFKQSGTGKLLMDYDDLLTVANEALASDKMLLSKYQQRYDYVLTDESQDTSLVQHLIIEKLVQKHGNVCVVADDDQSIYSWRGADPQYLLDFKKVYPNAKILMMEQNYRSSKDIVEVANRFIKRNKNRYDKNMFTENPPFKPISIKTFADYRHQSKYLVGDIANAEKFSDVAILYRNNSLSINVINELDREGVPFYMKDVDNRFFSHWVVEDILNFMRMTYTDKRADILEKIHMKMNGYITKQQMSALLKINNRESVFDNLLKYVSLQDYQVKQIEQNKELFKRIKGMPPKKVIHIIRTQLGYERALEKISERLGFRRENLFGILNTLEEIADSLKTMEDFAGRLKHLETVMKASTVKKNENVVTLSTFHSSKGLEFKKVYMIDLVDGTIPSYDDIKSYDEGQTTPMEEAARLFYVGMTRAKLELELLSYKEKNGVKVKTSQFVNDVRNILNPPKEIPKKEPIPKRNNKKKKARSNPNAISSKNELKVGAAINHRVFGKGEIVRLEDDIVEIHFKKKKKRLSVKTCIQMGVLEPVKKGT